MLPESLVVALLEQVLCMLYQQRFDSFSISPLLLCMLRLKLIHGHVHLCQRHLIQSIIALGPSLDPRAPVVP